MGIARCRLRLWVLMLVTPLGGKDRPSFVWEGGKKNPAAGAAAVAIWMFQRTVLFVPLRVNCAEMVQRLRLRLQALFLEVMAEKADQRCSTFLLPQCGHRTSPSS